MEGQLNVSRGGLYICDVQVSRDRRVDVLLTT